MYTDFCHAMLCKRGLSHPSCGLCLSVYVSVMFVHSVKMNKHIFKIFSLWGSHTILVFPYQTSWQYSNANFRNGASRAGVVGRISESRFWAPSRAVNAKCNALSCDGPWRVDDTSLISSRVCWWRETTKKCMTRSLNVTPKTTVQH